MPILTCLAAVAIDGDSIRCSNIGQVRLLAIDTAEYSQSRPCRGGYGDHVCDDAMAKAGKESLRAALRLGPVRVEPVTRDRYGRTVALVTVGGRDLSCWQLQRGVARYIVKYDNGGRVAARCPAAR
jgi:micrococcal nuclease